MITPDEEKYILQCAYVPEHITGLMVHLSGGEPFLIDDFFFCYGHKRVVLVGYPLQKDFNMKRFERIVKRIKKQFRPGSISLIAPELPPSISTICSERESDYYYTLETRKTPLSSAVKRNLKKARQALTVERSGRMHSEHDSLIREFVDRVNPPAAVRELLSKMPDYVGHGNRCFVLNAWDYRGNLAAFYIIDLAARNFSSYIIGCYSKKNYVLGASDLLLSETIEISIEHQKEYIHLGLGVNPGVRRFKEKWGGRPAFRYEMGELFLKKFSILDTIMALKKMNKAGRKDGTSADFF